VIKCQQVSTSVIRYVYSRVDIHYHPLSSVVSFVPVCSAIAVIIYCTVVHDNFLSYDHPSAHVDRRDLIDIWYPTAPYHLRIMLTHSYIGSPINRMPLSSYIDSPIIHGCSLRLAWYCWAPPGFFRVPGHLSAWIGLATS
jgi:hypothetical protein